MTNKRPTKFKPAARGFQFDEEEEELVEGRHAYYATPKRTVKTSGTIPKEKETKVKAITRLRRAAIDLGVDPLEAARQTLQHYLEFMDENGELPKGVYGAQLNDLFRFIHEAEKGTADAKNAQAAAVEAWLSAAPEVKDELDDELL
jgi:hypothetical protein